MNIILYLCGFGAHVWTSNIPVNKAKYVYSDDTLVLLRFIVFTPPPPPPSHFYHWILYSLSEILVKKISHNKSVSIVPIANFTFT